jgi:capsular polysaccharide biosynthesis protein
MTGSSFLKAVRRYWRTFVVATGLPLVVGVGWVMLWPATYVSTTQLMVTIDGSATATAYQNEDVVAERVNSYIPLLTSDVVVQRVVSALGLSESAGELAANISASNVPPKTSLIDVSVSDASAPQAKLIADTLAREFITYTNALETPTGQDGQKVHTRVVNPASDPQSRRTERIVLAGFVGFAAIVVGLVAVWVRAGTDPIVRTEEAAAAALGGPVIGTVRATPHAGGAEFEAYRRLRTRLRRLLPELPAGERRGRMWLLTSVGDEADTAVVAANLSRALESSGEPTILIAADAVAEPASGDEEPVDAVGDLDWADIEQMQVADGFAERLDGLRSDYAHVLVAAPPATAATSASILSEHADLALILVVRDRTNRRSLARSAEDLRLVGARLAAVMLPARDEASNFGQNLDPESSSRPDEQLRDETTIDKLISLVSRWRKRRQPDTP